MEKNNSLPLVVAVLVMAATTVFALVKGDSNPEPSAETVALQSTVEDLANQVGSMKEQMSSMTAQMQAAQAAGSMANAGVRREISQVQIDRMVADAVARLGPQINGGDVAADGVLTPEQEELAKQAKLDDALAKLLNPNLTEGGFKKLWKDLAEAGLLEEAIAMLEDQAAAYPENEDLQVQLGLAYLQPMNAGNVPPMEAGQWAIKADSTFDRVLEANPENWDARFIKAMSYTFWPAAYGKQQSAIDHFEILVDQQSRQNADPKFAQTHVFLGNMYYQTGQAEKAQEAWASGLAQYPNNTELQEKANSL